MRLLLGIALSSFCCVAMAADTDQLSAARRLVDLLQIEEMYRDTESMCRNDSNGVADARASYEAAQDSFQGMTPKSLYWGEVERLFKAYREDACGVLDIGAVKNIYTQVFANRLSVAELENSITAMGSPAAQKAQAASREAARMLMGYMLDRQRANAAKANQRFQQGVRELKARYEAAPR